MKMIKMALLGGAAMAVTAASAQADDLEALKAQIDSLNTRIAAMETAPSVPTGYQLIAVSQGELPQTPGMVMSARERFAYGNSATIISVLPTADAPAGTTITWSGYARAGLVYQNDKVDGKIRLYGRDADDPWTEVVQVDLDQGTPDTDDDTNIQFPIETDTDTDDFDVKARGQLRVKASTDTAVGEVGVDIRLRGNFNGNGAADVYTDVAWGYWSMTPELTFGGGYTGSLGNIGYGYDGACTCFYTDNADVAFNPGDTTQMRLSYASGPFGMAIALEDASIRAGGDNFGASDKLNGDQLGAAGEITYAGDSFSAEIAGVWRGVDDEQYTLAGYTLGDTGIDSLWQVGAGLSFSLADIATLSLAAAMGEGPFINENDGNIVSGLPYNQSWWGVSGLATMKLSDEFHFELGAGYKKRDGDDFDIVSDPVFEAAWTSDGIEYDTYAFMGGLYYTPVDQLTIGVESEWYTVSADGNLESENALTNFEEAKVELDREADTFSVDLVAVWRF